MNKFQNLGFFSQIFYFKQRSFLISFQSQCMSYSKTYSVDEIMKKTSEFQKNPNFPKDYLIFLRESLGNLLYRNVNLPASNKEELKSKIQNALISINSIEKYSTVFSYVLRNYGDLFLKIEDPLIIKLNKSSEDKLLNEYALMNYFIILSKHNFNLPLWERANVLLLKYENSNFLVLSDYSLMYIFERYCKLISDVVTFPHTSKIVWEKLILAILKRIDKFTLDKISLGIRGLQALSNSNEYVKDLHCYSLIETLWNQSISCLLKVNIESDLKNFCLILNHIVKKEKNNSKFWNLLMSRIIAIFPKFLIKDIIFILKCLAEIEHNEECKENIDKIYSVFYPKIYLKFNELGKSDKNILLVALSKTNKINEDLMNKLTRAHLNTLFLENNGIKSGEIGLIFSSLKKKYPTIFEKSKRYALNKFVLEKKNITEKNFGSIYLTFVEENNQQFENLIAERIEFFINSPQPNINHHEYLAFFSALKIKNLFASKPEVLMKICTLIIQDCNKIKINLEMEVLEEIQMILKFYIDNLKNQLDFNFKTIFHQEIKKFLGNEQFIKNCDANKLEEIIKLSKDLDN